MALEIVQQCEVPDVIVIPGGNLGNVSALGAGFDMMRELGIVTKAPRIVVAGGARQPALPRLQEQLGVRPVAARPGRWPPDPNRQPDVGPKEQEIRTLRRATTASSERATEAELADASAAADLTDMFNCPHTGVALAVLWPRLVARRCALR